jgi:hypothetical protein
METLENNAGINIHIFSFDLFCLNKLIATVELSHMDQKTSGMLVCSITQASRP